MYQCIYPHKLVDTHTCIHAHTPTHTLTICWKIIEKDTQHWAVAAHMYAHPLHKHRYSHFGWCSHADEASLFSGWGFTSTSETNTH